MVSVKVSDDFTSATVSEINSETDFVAKNDQFIALTKDTTAHIQNNSLQSVEELHSSTINGVKFEEYLKSQIATIGEKFSCKKIC